MNLYTIITFASAFSFYTVGFWLLLQNFSKPTYRNFALVLWMFASWDLFIVIWQNSNDRLMEEYWIRIMMLWPIFIPIFYFKFILHLIGEYRLHQKKLYLVYLSSLFFAISDLLGYFINGTSPKVTYVQHFPHASLLFPFYLAYFAIVIFYSLFLLYKKHKDAAPLFKLQIKFIIGGTIWAYLHNSTTYWWWFDLNVPPHSNIFLALALFIIIYEVITRHLVDLRLAIRKSTIYGLTALLLFSGVLIAKITLEPLVMEYHFWVDFLIIFAAVYSYPALKIRTYNFSNKYFFTSLYNPSKVIESLSHGLNTTLNISKIYKLIDEIFSDTFHSSAIAILLYDKSINNYRVSYSRGFATKEKHNFRNVRNYYQKTVAKKQPTLMEELKKELGSTNTHASGLFEDIEFYHIDVISPLFIEKRPIGLLLLGKKISGDIYNDDDLKVLKTAGEEISMAIENAKLYKRVEDFNKTLQQRVEEQTKDLKDKNEHLVKLAEMRSEFLDIASHQLRTPVSVIKGVLSMIDEGSIPPDKIKMFIDGALEKSIKLSEIINDLLRASEMDTEKFKLSNKPMRLEDIFKKIREDKTRAALLKNVKISFDFPAEPLPLVLADERYLDHAITNLINNALQYTPNGTVNVSARIENNQVVIRVADNGIGIMPEDQKKLFQKFSRGKNAVEAYADGSGLGLFIVKQIVDAIPDSFIKIEKSEPGKGTTFALGLPIAPTEANQPIQTAIVPVTA